MTDQITIRRGADTYTLPCTAATSILEAAEKQGLALSSSCRRGDCGQCAATLIAGQVQAVSSAFPHQLRNDVLLCNCTALGDVELRLPWYPEAAHLRRLRSPCKLGALQRRNDVMEVELRVPPALSFNFLPGQFIKLSLPDGLTRSYSLARAPNADKRLHIHVRQVEGGAFSDYLFNRARTGDLLQLEGPFGHFFLRERNEVSHSIFLATGTGIAPIFAMMEGMNADQRSRCGSINIYWGNRSREDFYLRDAMLALCERIGVSCELLTSRDVELSSGATRHVQLAMARDFARLDNAQVYACGNPGMIQDAAQLAVERGLPEERFHSDPFTAS